MSQSDPTMTSRTMKPSTFHEPNVLAMLEYLVDEYGGRYSVPHSGRPRGEPPPHGTLQRYKKPFGCRCEECRAANTAYGQAYMRKWRARGGGPATSGSPNHQD